MADAATTYCAVRPGESVLSGRRHTGQFDAAFHLLFTEETPRLCHNFFRVYVLVNPSLAFLLRDGFF